MGIPTGGWPECLACDGTGRDGVEDEACVYCGGKGRTPDPPEFGDIREGDDPEFVRRFVRDWKILKIRILN
jgi:RecJ-like exonuclease